MSRIFITGSSDGLGELAADHLINAGHRVTIHARNEQRAADARAALPDADSILIGDLSSIAAAKQLAKDANDLATFDCVIHNAGIYQGPFRKTADGYPSLLAVNVLAPYVLTCLMHKPKNTLVFVSSDSHYTGDAELQDLLWQERGEAAWSDSKAYSDSKLCDTLLANAFARRWGDVKVNSFHPGWVATKMGGASAPGSIPDGLETYALLARGEGKGHCTGKFFFPGGKERKPQEEAESVEVQERLLRICEKATGVSPP